MSQDYFVRVPRPLAYESNKSTFSRSSIRSSKRLKKEGETGYTKPGPPTPGRNKSLGNLSLPKINPNTSSSSLEKNTSKLGRTPLNVKKFLGSAFKRGGKSKSYKMM